MRTFALMASRGSVELLLKELANILKMYPEARFIVGGLAGPDKKISKVIVEAGRDVEIVSIEEPRSGNAVMIRNEHIAQACDEAIVAWDQRTASISDFVSRMLVRNKDVVLLHEGAFDPTPAGKRLRKPGLPQLEMFPQEGVAP